MTLRIGALAQEPVPVAPCIVLCFDSKVANDAWGSESEYKLSVLSDKLVALYAGSPGRAKELALIYEDYLSRTPLSFTSATAQLREPLRIFKHRLSGSGIERRLG